MNQEMAIVLFAVVILVAAVGIFRRFRKPSARRKLPFPGTPRDDEKDR